MNDELEVLKRAKETFQRPYEENIRINDAMTYANRLPTHHPREDLESRISPDDQARMDIEGVLLPNKAANLKQDDQGTYPVSEKGERIPFVRRPAVLPFTVDDNDIRFTVPYALDLAGNVMGGLFAPVKGAGVALGAGPVRRATEIATRELNPQGMYSAAEDVLRGLKQEKMSGRDMINYMKNRAPQEELKQTGFEEWASSRPSVTRQEAMDYLRGQQPEIKETVLGGKLPEIRTPPISHDEFLTLDYKIARGEQLTPEETTRYQAFEKWKNELPKEKLPAPTKYQKYTLPGGKNYREVLLSLPTEWSPKIEEKYGRFGFTGPDGKYRDYWSRQDAEQASRSFLRNDAAKYTSSHWDEPNVLAHLRMSDRNIDGRKVLHIEEIQSDWAQEGRKKGFRNLENEKINKEIEDIRKKLDDDYESLSPEDRLVLKARRDELKKQLVEEGIIPQAPYVTDTNRWTQLALKRALREAAQGGYDEMIITPGVEQAKRYDLSKQISKIDFTGTNDGNTGVLSAFDLNGNKVISKSVSNPKEIEDLVGKDVAKKLFEQEPKDAKSGMKQFSLSGQNLSVGGEGMIGYYDKIVPAQLNKLIKEIDPKAKVERTNAKINKGNLGDRENQLAFYNTLEPDAKPKIDDQMARGRSFEDSLRKMGLWADYENFSKFRGMEFISVKFSPEFREKILTQGFKTFKDGGAVNEMPTTKYLPHVGRQVSNSGGKIHKALKIVERFGGSPCSAVDELKRHRGRPINS